MSFVSNGSSRLGEVDSDARLFQGEWFSSVSVNSTKLGKQMDAFESDNATAKGEREEVIEVLRLSQVQTMTGLCRSSIYQMEAQGRFPRRIKIGVRAVGWAKGDVQKWLRVRLEASAVIISH